MVEERKKGIEVASNVYKSARLLMNTELGPSEDLSQLLYSAETTRQGNESIGEVKHQLLSIVHRGHYAEVG